MHLMMGIFLLIAAIFIPSESLPSMNSDDRINAEFSRLSSSLYVNMTRIITIRTELTQILGLSLTDDIKSILDSYSGFAIAQCLSEAETIHLYQIQLLGLSKHIKKEMKSNYYEGLKINTQWAIERLSMLLEQIQTMNSQIDSNAALFQIDKAKEIIRSTLKLLNQTIKIKKPTTKEDLP